MAKLSGSSSSSNSSHHHLGHLPVWLLSAVLRAAKMEGKASGVLKQVRHQVASFVRAKLAAVKGKTSAVKTQLIVFGLLHNRKVLMSAIADKIHTLISSSQKQHGKPVADAPNDDVVGSMMVVALQQINTPPSLSSKKLGAPPAEASSREACTVESGRTAGGGREIISTTEDEEEMGYYPPDHRLLLSNSLNILAHDEVVGTGGIEQAVMADAGVKESQQREDYLQGDQPVVLEEEIDQVAELFIKRFRRQMMLERLESFRRHHQGGGA